MTISQFINRTHNSNTEDDLHAIHDRIRKLVLDRATALHKGYEDVAVNLTKQLLQAFADLGENAPRHPEFIHGKDGKVFFFAGFKANGDAVYKAWNSSDEANKQILEALGSHIFERTATAQKGLTPLHRIAAEHSAEVRSPSFGHAPMIDGQVLQQMGLLPGSDPQKLREFAAAYGAA